MSKKIKKPHNVHLHVMMPPELYDRLYNAATRKGTHISSLVRMLITEYLEKTEK